MDQEIQLNQRPSPQRQQQAQEHGGATAPAPAPATPQDDEQQGHQAAVARHGCGGATAERHHQTKLTLLPLVFFIYFEVAGGPYGAEQAVSAAGPLFALLGFLAFPFAWGVPYLSCVINLAAFPALVADYLGRVAPAVAVPGSRARTGTVLGMTVFLSFLNLGGLSIVGWGAVALGFVSLAPFVLMTAMAAPRTRPRRWAARVQVKGKRDWRLFFNTLFWNLNYWDSASTMAGEVERPERTFPRALAVAVVLIAVSYLLPLMAAVGATDAPPEAWENGYLADAAATKLVRNLKGPATSIPLYQNYNSLHHRRAVALVLDGGRPGALLRRVFQTPADQRPVPAPRHGGPGPPPLRLRPPRPRTIRHPVGPPLAPSAAVSVAVSFLGFDDVVATANLLYSLGTLLEFAAFLWLRCRGRHAAALKRPYRVPLPLPALAAMCLVPSAFLAYVIAVAGWRVSAIAAGLTALGVGWHGVMRVCRSKKWLGFNTVVAAGPHLQLQDDPPAADRV
ncbi:hypothetical protein OsJ_11027 [Oryza sativa Japonica Group]|uniref:Uncharacterized protein n=1 Tax=Oryza sativa subsp. japonica TaxID=39947 RepID=A3AIF7_ORYSJ|nr:hypothetical protein OsJ_11027 [Oryza sativa Japonica Group]